MLFINHVVGQEREAQSRLVRQKGSVVHLRFGVLEIDLLVTPAGLIDRAPLSAKPDLLVVIPADSPLALIDTVVSGAKPPVRIEGDVQLAAEIAWLADNLRWDIEEDLARLIGDAPAHALADAGRRVLAGLRQFLQRRQGSSGPKANETVQPAASPSRDSGTQADGARADR
ncbi:MAG: hypothetical protein LH479_13070 [Polaromonas sp.]|nr:hypothetical protein [Polaromonas sp.]